MTSWDTLIKALFPVNDLNIRHSSKQLFAAALFIRTNVKLVKIKTVIFPVAWHWTAGELNRLFYTLYLRQTGWCFMHIAAAQTFQYTVQTAVINVFFDLQSSFMWDHMVI